MTTVQSYFLSHSNEIFTIRVDANTLNLQPGRAVNLVGTFNNWCGTCDPMADTDGNGVWEHTMELPSGNHEYK